MGWATYLTCNIVFNRETYNSIHEVHSSLAECKDMIKYLETKLKSLAVMTEPKKFCDEDDDPLAWVELQVKESLEELEEQYIERAKLELLLENWSNCHDSEGYAIKSPESFSFDTAYLEGDFIKHKEDEKSTEVL